MNIGRVTIVGCGLIGGSFAKLLRKKMPGTHISGIDTREVAEKIKDDPAFDSVDDEANFTAAVGEADLTLLALPPGKILEMLPRTLADASDGSIVSDFGSVKKQVVDRAAEIESGAHFIGGHPIGGSHGCGFEASSAELLDGAKFIVTPSEKTSSDILSSYT